ncbi:MAG: fumarate hydratase C-terminal domain-containing protein [Candidatus Eisenbacteria bacterium]|nr:fumarate hydratase C-terminal domain-containing protein [Candidatus Eisenbacteria bacterium]
MIKIKLPASEEDIRKLKAGDEVAITGVMITGRDAAHKYLVETDGPEVKGILKGGMIYHCGPVVKKEGGKYSFVAAGPTTSIREEPYQAAVIEKYGLRGVIGKGGMGAKTLKACADFGCVYLSAVGGLATILAKSVVEVPDVHKLEEFGVPEAMWVIQVEDFPAVVTMDAHGRSIHDEIATLSKANYDRLLSEE